MPTWAKLTFILAGLLSLAGALFEWNWFMTHPKATVVVKLLGRTGARVFYAILGAFALALGLGGAFGLL